jgi:hypothetical protein
LLLRRRRLNGRQLNARAQCRSPGPPLHASTHKFYIGTRRIGGTAAAPRLAVAMIERQRYHQAAADAASDADRGPFERRRGSRLAPTAAASRRFGSLAVSLRGSGLDLCGSGNHPGGAAFLTGGYR